MPDYPVRDANGNLIVEHAQDEAWTPPEPYDYTGDYPVRDGAGGTIIAHPFDPALPGHDPVPVPANSVAPAITGDLIDGETLSLSAGTWTPTPDEVERQWLADASPVGSGSTLDLTGREGEVISARTRARMTGGDWSEWEDATGGGEVQPAHVPQTYALVGNSLFNFGLDHSVASILAGLAHPTDTVVQQITFNQNLTTNWNNPSGRTTGIDVKAALASDSADFLALVDLPALNDSDVDVAPVIVDWWEQAANPSLRGTFYQMWYPVPGFPGSPDWTLWKAFIVFLRPYHNRVLYDVRAALGGPEVLLAPVADVLAAIYDDRVALGITFADFWYDALHPSQLGYYVAALTHWAVMHQQSPVGLPWSFSPAIPGLTAPLAAALQAKVWSVVNADAYAKPGTWPSTVIPAPFTSGMWDLDPGDGQLDVTINSTPDNGGASLTDIEYELDGSGTWNPSGGTGNFSITSGVTNGVEADVRIRAKNSVGSGVASDVKAETPASSATAPSAYGSGQWTATPIVDGIAVGDLTHPSDGGSSILRTEYRLNGGSEVSFGNTTGGNIAGLTRGTSYDVQIRDVNAIGAGPWSDTKTRTPPWQCSLTSAFFDFGGGDGFMGAGFSPWALNWGSKNREPIPGVTMIAAYTYTVNNETYIAFQGDQRSILDGKSVYINSVQYSGTWVYNASSDYGVPATILVANTTAISSGTHSMEIR